jgi:hypothetical protein
MDFVSRVWHEGKGHGISAVDIAQHAVQHGQQRPPFYVGNFVRTLVPPMLAASPLIPLPWILVKLEGVRIYAFLFLTIWEGSGRICSRELGDF